MSRKSEVVPLGIELKSEQNYGEMVEILTALNNYIPTVSVTRRVMLPGDDSQIVEDDICPILFGGDQMTAARVRGCQRICSNSERETERLKGFIGVCEDWHAKQSFLGVVWKRLFNTASGMDGGTLYQLRNLINRRNVVRKPKNNMNACEDFFQLVVESHILVSAMTVFKMSSVDDKPCTSFFPDLSSDLNREQRRKVLLLAVENVLDKYVDLGYGEQSDGAKSRSDVRSKKMSRSRSRAGARAGTRTARAGAVSESHGVQSGGGPAAESGATCMPTSKSGGGTQSHESEPVTTKLDGIQSYACEVLSLGLLYMEFCDAVREGDGNRILRCWKFLLLIFRATKRTNYSIEAFILLVQYTFLFSPRMAAQLKWNRTVNVHGRPGKNVSCDLHMEHLNRECKGALHALGSNITDQSVKRVGKSIQKTVKLLHAFDRQNGVREESSHHTRRSVSEDMKRLLAQLLDKSRVFENHGDQHQTDQHKKDQHKKDQHKTFPAFSRNVMSKVCMPTLDDWMKQQMQKLVRFST